MSGFKYEAVYSSVGNVLLWEENLVKLLGVLIFSGLNINSYMQGTCKKRFTKHSFYIAHYFRCFIVAN